MYDYDDNSSRNTAKLSSPYDNDDDLDDTLRNPVDHKVIVTYDIPEDAADESVQQTKTFIKEADELKDLIIKIVSTNSFSTDGFESATNRVTQILEQYQEQSNLLDVHLNQLVVPLIEAIRALTDSMSGAQVIASIVDNEVLDNKEYIKYAYRILYVLTKVRGFKSIVKLLPHSVADLLPVVSLLEYKTNLYYQQSTTTHGATYSRTNSHYSSSSSTVESPSSAAPVIDSNGVYINYDSPLPIHRQIDNNNPNAVSWEEIYILSLWLSLLIIIPFKFPSIDGLAVSDHSSIASRIIRLAKRSLSHPSKFSDSYAELLSKLLTRPDMSDELVSFIEYAAQSIQSIRKKRADGITDSNDAMLFRGLLTCLTSIFKKAPRSTLQPLSPLLYQQIISSLSQPTEIERMCKKLLAKLLQRMALVILPPISATWRYQRVIKPLLSNSNSTTNSNQIDFQKEKEDEDEEDQDIPDEIEEIIDVLISQGLSDRDTIVRWSSAKGAGRIINLLPKDMGDQVISLIFTLFEDEQSDSQWHGACLAMAELCRRGLILPERLDQLVQIVVRALQFDVIRGTTSVGSHVRDAACYISWALARTYHPSIMQPYSFLLAKNLVVAALLDREINCRKSASAAYQENVGRQGAAIPHGIDIVQLADYFAVGNKRNSYLELTPTIANYAEYQHLLMENLVLSKIYHWDNEIRELATKSIALVLPLNPQYFIQQIPAIIKNTNSEQISIKHGSLLALHEILISLKTIDQAVLLTDDIVNSILVVIKDKRLEKLYKGKGGVYIRTGICKLIRSICMCSFTLNNQIVLDESAKSSASSSAVLRQRIDALRSKRQALAAGNKGVQQPSKEQTPESNENAFDTLLKYLEESIQHPIPDVQKEASLALKVLINNYMIPDKYPKLLQVVEQYEKVLLKDPNPPSRRGASLLLGVLPCQLHKDHPDQSTKIINVLIQSIFDENPVYKDIETRVNSLYSLERLINIFYEGALITRDLFTMLFDKLLLATEDYSIDKRGDVGSWVRELACKIIATLIELDIKRHQADKLANELFISKDIVLRYLCKLIQISGEKLDKLRLTSCLIITRIVWAEELSDYIINKAELQAIFTRDNQITWSRSNESFPIICRVLAIDSYLYYLVFGLFSSIGGPSKYLVDDSLYSIQLYFNGYDENPEEKKRQVIRVASTFIKIINSTNKERSIVSTFRAIAKLFETREFDSLSITSTDIILEVCNLTKQILLSNLKDIRLLIQSIPMYSYFINDCFNEQVKHFGIEMVLFLLGNKYPKVRMLASDELRKMFSANERLVTLLDGQGWDQDLKNIAPVLHKIYQLLNIVPPTKHLPEIRESTSTNNNVYQSSSAQPLVPNQYMLPEDSEDLMEI